MHTQRTEKRTTIGLCHIPPLKTFDVILLVAPGWWQFLVVVVVIAPAALLQQSQH
jgi:hypothetical protein